jgi:hypothetical protein
VSFTPAQPEDTVQAFNDSWSLPPAEGEVFESEKAYLAHLQGQFIANTPAEVT